MITVSELLGAAKARLTQAGIESAALDARLLLSEAVGEPVWPHQSGEVGEDRIEAFEALLVRRLNREPVSRIVGQRGFWTLELEISPDTLDPRPETETLVEAALHWMKERPPQRILDLGTGSGCILLALLSEFPEAGGLGIDRLAGAIEVARRNAERAGCQARARFEQLDWSSGLAGDFDLIVSNPPYIESGEISSLEPEVTRFDPMGALVAGEDGLEAYRTLAPIISRVLSEEGVVILELGQGQEPAVSEIYGAAGYSVVECRPDLAGIGRALVLKRKFTGENY